MRLLSTLLGLLSAAVAVVVLRPVNSYRAFMVKATATAQTPALTLLGTLAAVFAIRRRARFPAIAGLFGAGVGGCYISRVTAPHDGFERAFGSDWQRRMPQEQERYMMRRRRAWRLPSVPEPRWTRDVSFCTIPGTDRQLRTDIWEPAAGIARSGTVIVYLYGGSWHFFDKDVLTRPFFRQLAAQGHVVMDAAHRSSPEVDITGMVGDVHRAVAWIKANADRYGVDPGQVVVMGGSSGAHIALLAAFAPDNPALKPGELQEVDTSVLAVVSYYGIPDMYSTRERWLAQEGPSSSRPPVAYQRREPGKLDDVLNTMMLGRTLTAAQSPPAPPVHQLLRNLVGGEPGEVREMYDLASPILHASAACPPTLMFQGTHDAVVPLDAARRLYQALETAGVPVVYVEYPWTEHAFDLMYPPLANPAAKAALYDLERFLLYVASCHVHREASDPQDVAFSGRSGDHAASSPSSG
jgi:acetyl esterase/lipase